MNKSPSTFNLTSDQEILNWRKARSKILHWCIMAPICNTRIWEAEVDTCKSEARLGYIESSKPARAVQLDPISKHQKGKKKRKAMCW